MVPRDFGTLILKCNVSIKFLPSGIRSLILDVQLGVSVEAKKLGRYHWEESFGDWIGGHQNIGNMNREGEYWGLRRERAGDREDEGVGDG